MSMKIQKRRGFRLNHAFLGAVLLAVSTLVQPFFNAVQALQTTQYTNAAFTSSELANWSEDRKTPSSFSSVAFGGRGDVLEMNIDAEAQSTQGDFYHTEGLRRQIPASDSIKADLYVDADWQNKETRAGLWGVASDASGEITAYPIVEFTTATEAGHTGWRVYDGVYPGGWTNLATPFTWNSWNTLAVTFNESTHKFDLSINGAVVASNSYDETTTHLKAAILNSKNYGSNGQDYSVHWSNFAYGNVVDVPATPANLKFASPDLACGATTDSYAIVPTWDIAEGAANYEYWVATPGTHNVDNPWSTVVGTNSYSGAFTEGEGVYTFKVRSINSEGVPSEWSTPCTVKYSTAPVLTVTSPSEGAVVSTKANGNKLTVKGSFTDNVKANYANLQLVYKGNLVANQTFYGYGSVFDPAATYANADGSYTYNMSVPSTLESGTYELFYVGTDFDGNVTERMKRTIVIDNTAPVVAITSPSTGAVVQGTVNITGTVTDEHPMNSYFVITGPNGYRVTSFYGDGRLSHTYSWNTAGLADGQYKIQFEARDKVQNKTNASVASVTVTVANTVPSVNAEDFGVGAWTMQDQGFTGINVGFNIAGFGSVSGVTVDVYDEDGLRATNTATAGLLALINEDSVLQHSSPFVVQGSLVDTWCDGPCWNLGSATWDKTKLPVKAIITVAGINRAGQDVVKTAQNTNFTEASTTFANLFPVSIPQMLGATTDKPSAGGSSAPTVSPQLAYQAPIQQRSVYRTLSNGYGATAAAYLDSTSGDTEATAATPAAENAVNPVLGAQDVAGNFGEVEADMADESSAWGLMKYWWIPALLLGLGLVWWLIAAMRRKHEND